MSSDAAAGTEKEKGKRKKETHENTRTTKFWLTPLALMIFILTF